MIVCFQDSGKGSWSWRWLWSDSNFCAWPVLPTCLPLAYEGTALQWADQTRQSISLFDIHVEYIRLCVWQWSLNKCAFGQMLYSITLLMVSIFAQMIHLGYITFFHFEFHTHMPACCHTPHTDFHLTVIITSFSVMPRPNPLWNDWKLQWI